MKSEAAIGVFGGQTMTQKLRRVLVRSPREADAVLWGSHGWRAQPNPLKARKEHEAFCELMASFGVEVIEARSGLGPDPDAIYVCDPAIMTDPGAIILRPGKVQRRPEAEAMVDDFAALQVPIAATMQAPATAEGGDVLWLDERTLLVGRSYRTNAQGIEFLKSSLPAAEVIWFDLPHLRGDAEVLHLMSLISLLDRDLAVACVPLLPIRLVELLSSRDIRVVEVPDQEFASMGPNVLAVGPRVAIALDGSPKTRIRMEHAGVDVTVYRGDEISVKGDGGPTCLTRSILRADQLAPT